MRLQRPFTTASWHPLIAEDDEERRMNLKEYYDFCESLGMYDRADEIERELQNNAIKPVPTAA